MNTSSLPYNSQATFTPPSALDLIHIQKALVLAPHPDDETIGCGGLLALLAEQGTPAHIILVSDGSGAGALSEGSDIRRQQEFAQALSVLGPTITWECWQLPDGALFQANDLQQRLNTAIKDYQPSVLLAPWLQDMHPDHAIVGHTAQQAHLQQNLPQGVLFYEVWSPLPANLILDISPVWQKKQAALQLHVTALEHCDYPRATEALAAYRSLLLTTLEQDGQYAEAYYGLDWKTQSATTETISIRYATKRDAHSLTQLFCDVFKHQVPDVWWHTKYAGQMIAGTVAVDDKQQVIAYYGALVRSGTWQGQSLSTAQQADVMVAKDHRFSTRTGGVFSRISQLFLYEQLGPERPFQMAFGFPTVRALKLGIRLGLYQQADTTLFWAQPNQRKKLGWGWRTNLVPCADVEQWQWVDQLKPFMSEPEDYFWLQKTATYWQQRFAQHPEKNYLLLRLTYWGRLHAAAIVLPTQDGLEIMDLALTNDKETNAIPIQQRLLQAITNAALRMELQYTTAWGTESAINSLNTFSVCPHAATTECGFMALPSDQLDAPLSNLIKNHCWMLGGDTDFR